MRYSQNIKTLLRSPVRTLLAFLLLTAATFALLSMVLEYAAAAHAMESAAGRYFGVGSAELSPYDERFSPDYPYYMYTDPRVAVRFPADRQEFWLNTVRYQALTSEQLDTISELPYVTDVSRRFMTAGVSADYCRLDAGEPYYNYTARCVIEGTLADAVYGSVTEDQFSLSGSGMEIFHRLYLDDIKVLAGSSKFAEEHDSIMIYSFPTFAERNLPEQSPDSLPGGVNGMYHTRLVSITWPGHKYGKDFIENLDIGARYTFVVRYEPLQEEETDPLYIADSVYYLGDFMTDIWCDAIQPVPEDTAAYLGTAGFAPLRELIEITEADTRTFDVVYTDDMSAIMRFAEGNMGITDGRMITPEDGDSPVCVISREVSEVYGLKVGDSFPLTLGTELFEQYYTIGAAAVTEERYSPAEKPAALEIVGIYADLDGAGNRQGRPNWCYSINTVFVPKTLLPVDEAALSGHLFTPSEFSFKIENAHNITPFLETAAPMLEEMGMKLIFDDAGWPDIAESFRESSLLSAVNIAVFSLAAAAVIGVSVYLFIGRKKHEYAIMRALGSTKRNSGKALIYPFLSLEILGMLTGGCAAWIYTAVTIAGSASLAALASDAASPDVSIPVGVIIACVAGEFLLALVFALTVTRRLGKKSSLTLLQTNGERRAGNGKSARRRK